MGKNKQQTERNNRKKGGETTGQKKTYQKSNLSAAEAEQQEPEIHRALEEKMECIPE